MKKLFLQILIIITGLIPVNFCNAQAKDSIFLYKGQELIGDIKQSELGVITIDDMDLRKVNIKQYKIKRMNTSQSFRIETGDRLIYYGTLGPSSKDGWTDITLSDGKKITIQITDISTMVFLEKTFFKRLEGNVSAGFSYSKSSSVGQFNLSSAVTYATKSVESSLTTSAIGSLDSLGYSRDNENVELFSNYNINSSWFVAGLVAYQRNIELSIARRFQEMAGAGSKVLLEKNLQLKLISGLTFNQEKSTDDIASGLLLEIPLMARFDFYKFRHPNIQISTSQTIYFGLTQAGRVRYNGSTTFSLELIRDFYFNLNLYSSYDNRPPATSSHNTDYGIVFGLSYKF